MAVSHTWVIHFLGEKTLKLQYFLRIGEGMKILTSNQIYDHEA
jgi:hypothetical protein